MQPYYQDSAVTIYHGQWQDVGLVLADVVITDPPYNAINRETGGLRTINKGRADSEPVSMTEVIGMVDDSGASSVYIWCAQEQLSEWLARLQDKGFTTRSGVWIKTDPSPMNGEYLWLSAVELCAFGRRAGAVFNQFCAAPAWRGATARPTGHPTPKPEWLIAKQVYASSNPHQLILDPFMGGGTTLSVAKTANRRAVGIEIEERYCEIAAQRCAQEVLDL